MDTIDRRTLTSQCDRILARLKLGPVSNVELSTSYALNYHCRISSQRKRGYSVENFGHDRQTGRTWYRLIPTDHGAMPDAPTSVPAVSP